MMLPLRVVEESKTLLFKSSTTAWTDTT